MGLYDRVPTATLLELNGAARLAEQRERRESPAPAVDAAQRATKDEVTEVIRQTESR